MQQLVLKMHRFDADAVESFLRGFIHAALQVKTASEGRERTRDDFDSTRGERDCVIKERERQMSFILLCVTDFNLSSSEGKRVNIDSFKRQALTLELCFFP